ncbi:MFS transporter [Rhodohalobacter sp. SW132]|uniref:MFS transporter n=1 Tax=Rhodohalobacter sp. SW132 TaxID=2293433 RepID=UPI0018F383DC|nr:MFS transporter [Rhodohalobacter sp. SW132]
MNNSGDNGVKLERPRLTFKEKVGYGLGDMASNLYFQTFVLFLPIFYTDVFGIPAAAMGTMMLVTRVWDAVTDPVMGMIADRTQTRWGKFRPYIISFAIPLAVGGVLVFSTPDLGDSGKLIYAYATYMLLMMLYTAINVPYSALMGVITPNSMERTEVSSFRFVAAFGGQVIVGAATLGLVEYLGGGDETLGWQMTMVAYGALAVALLFATFYLTKERVSPKKEVRNKPSADLKDLFMNKPWVLVGLATLFQLTYIVMRGSSTTYYFRYFVGDQQLNLLGWNIDLTYALFTSSFITAGTIATLIGAVLTKYFTKLLDKKFVYSGFLLSSAAFSCAFFFLEPDNVVLMYVLNVLVSFFFGSVSVLQWAIYTDAADYGEWKFGRRATALIMAASLFMLKLGLTFGGAITGWMLEFHNFVPLAEQSEYTITGIKLLMSVYPAIFGFIGGAIMLFYPLRDVTMVKIEEDLLARKEKAGQES